VNLVIIRHGRAEDFAETDEKRALTAEGRDELNALIPLWGKMLPAPDLILSSPYLRARESAICVQQQLAPELPLEISSLLTPESYPLEIFQFLKSESAETVWLFSHQPLVSHLVSIAVSGRESTNISFPRAGAAFVQFPGVIADGKGRLRALLRPEQLRAAKGL
jgi:phosphohistidine phosphatase